MNAACHSHENILHSLSREGGSFKKQNFCLLRNPRRLQKRHLTLTLQISLITNDHHTYVLPSKLLSVIQPLLNVRERIPIGYIVDDYSTSSAAVIRPRDGPKPLLPRSVPYLQLNTLATHGYYSRAKLYTYGLSGAVFVPFGR